MPSCRRWQFGLRALLALTALVAAALGLWAAYVAPYRREARIAAHIERLGGRVTMEPAGPEWLRRLFGDEQFRVVTGVSLGRQRSGQFVVLTKTTDADLQLIGGLRHLRSLDLSETAITDKGIVHLVRLDALEELLLADTRVTDKGVASLRDAKSLRWLSLNYCDVTNGSLEDLGALPNLELVLLHQTHVTREGLRDLAAVSAKLHIQCCRIKPLRTSVKRDFMHYDNEYFDLLLPVVEFELRNVSPHAVQVYPGSRGLDYLDNAQWYPDSPANIDGAVRQLASGEAMTCKVEGGDQHRIVRVSMCVSAGTEVPVNFRRSRVRSAPVTVTDIPE